MTTKTFSNRDLMRCAQREYGKRMNYYHRAIADGKMTQAKADEELAMMQAISLHFGALAEEDDKRARLL